MRGSKQGSSLTEVPVQTESYGKLLRSQKGQIRIIIDPDLPLQPGSNISFGDTKALVSSKEQNVLTLQKVEGVLPTHAKVVWHHVAVTPDEIYDEFRRFWSPMWLRDSYQDQFSSDKWQSFMQELDDIPFPHCNVQVSVDDPAIWKRAIRKLKNIKMVKLMELVDGAMKNSNAYKVGPLLVINGVITPISRAITPLTHL